MKNIEALEVLKKESACRHLPDKDCFGKVCVNCPYRVSANQFLRAIDTAISALELCVMVDDDGR